MYSLRIVVLINKYSVSVPGSDPLMFRKMQARLEILPAETPTSSWVLNNVFITLPEMTYYLPLSKVLNKRRLLMLQACQEAKRDLQIHLEDELGDGRPVKDIVADVRDIAQKHFIPEQEVIPLVRWCLSYNTVFTLCFSHWQRTLDLTCKLSCNFPVSHIKYY